MIVRQRQIVEVQFPVPPNGKLMQHPCIVLSNNDINDQEQAFVAVMLTSEERYRNDLYSLEITDKMLNKPMPVKFSAARIHLIANFLYRDIISNSWKNVELTEEAFIKLKSYINRITFGNED